MKQILIIGGSGYIGSMITNALKENYNVTVLDINSYECDIFQNVTIIKSNMKNINKCFISKYDIIICLAGNSSVKSSENIFSGIENNITNLISLFKLITNEQKIIYASSSSVYGNTKDDIVDETYNNIDFHNYYDFSKKSLDMYAEIIIKKLHKNIFGLRFGTVNGFSPNFRNDIMINAMTTNALKEKNVKVFSKQTKRPILGIRDLCKSIKHIIEYGNKDNAGIYNLASFNSTVEEIGIIVSNLLNVPCKYINELKENITNVKTSSYNFSINCNKFCKNFNFNFEDTIESIVTDITTNYDKIIINNSRNIDQYIDYVFPLKGKEKCRVCNTNVKSILDLNIQPLANSFHNNLFELEKYPLTLMLCENCFHLQLSHVVNSKLLYKDYIYKSGTSKTLLKYFDDLYNKINGKIECENKTVIEIACNDGSQLNFFKEGGWNTIGVDPAKNLALISGKNHDIYCDFMIENVATSIMNKYNKIDVILCQNVFAHTDDIDEFIRACKICMNNNTKLYIQVSQANLIRDNQYDTVYHEHLSFFNISSMKHIIEKHNLYISHIEKPSIHGVSYLFEIGKIKDEKTNLYVMLEEENSIGLNKIETYLKYSKECRRKSYIFKINILKHVLDGYTVIGYGASAKGNTILNYLNITNNEVKYIVDDQITKQGLYTPGSNISICDKSKLADFDKVAVLMITWNFKDEIMRKVKDVRGEKETKYIFY